jgi:hypothetical protein
MKMVHVAKTPNGYLVLDATSASSDTASFAPFSEVDSEEALRTLLAKFGFAGSVIDQAVLEVNKTGQANLSLEA